MSSHSFTRRVPLVFLLFILFVILAIPSLSWARDPHPRKVRIKNENGNIASGTPLVYGSLYGIRLKDKLGSSAGKYCQEGDWKCDCFFEPYGPMDQWVKIQRPSNPKYGDQCYAPPYSTSGPWWDWLLSRMDTMKQQIQGDLEQIPAIGVYLGMDGECRPLKSGDGWKTKEGNSDMLSQFRNTYVPAVIQEIQRRYPGKTIRAQTSADTKGPFLEAEIDFHRESLAADEQAAYLYENLSGQMGWWQGYADHYWVTNTLGLGQGWPPVYISALSALSKHTDSMTGGLDWWDKGITEDFSKWVQSYVGRDIRDTPGTWIFLRDTLVRKKEWWLSGEDPKCGQTERLWESEAKNTSGKYGDYDFYLYRPDELDGNHTVPVRADSLPPGTKKQIYTWSGGTVYDTTRNFWGTLKDANCQAIGGKSITFTKYVGRKVADGSRYMSFDIDDGYAYRFAGQPGVSYDFRIVYLDQGTDTFKLQYKNKDGQWQEKPILKTNTNLWKDVTINVTDGVLNNGASEGSNASLYPTDFRLDFGSPTVPTVIHLLEVRGKGGMAKEEIRPKAQIAVDLIRNKEDEPEKGIYSMGLNQTFWVKATLLDNQKRPIPNERVMFAYNTEWNLAKSALTDQNGVAYQWFSTANNLNSSGFLAGSRPSSYSIQAYFPGSERYQPSRNDAKLWVTDSPSPTDSRNLRMEIKAISPIQADGKVNVTYQLYNPAGPVGGSGVVSIGRKDGFYADDPNAQTISILGSASGYFTTSNHVTLYGNSVGDPGKVTNVGVSNGPMQGQVTLAWNPNMESNIAGYRVFYGTESGIYTKVFGVGNTNTATISGLSPGKTYYFTVRAHNMKAYEGEYSAEVSKTVGASGNTLFVRKGGTGTGTVSGTGINCGQDCEEIYTPGAGLTITAAADAGSIFTGWSGEGCTGTGPCTLVMSVNKTITAIFNSTSPPPASYTITASAGSGGTITPLGTVTVNSGGSKALAIVPNTGYRIVDVLVDGVSQGAIAAYTFSSVTTNHAITATFASATPGNQRVFAVNCGGPQYTDRSGNVYQADTNFSGGSASTVTNPIDGTEEDLLYQSERWGTFSYNIPVPNGTYNVTLKFAEIHNGILRSGQRVFSVKMEGKEVLSNLDLYSTVGSYKVYDVTISANVTDGVLNINFTPSANNAKVNAIVVTTAAPVSQYTIAVSAGPGGTITPSGTVLINSGATQEFKITPNAGYSILDVKVDGVSRGAISSFTFNNVTANQTIAAVFNSLGITQYTLNVAKVGAGNGTVTSSPVGTAFNAGTAVTLTAAANEDSVFSGWSGACTGTGTCKVTLNANLSVTATFGLKDPNLDPQKGVFDMNGDGKPEILWQHQTRGEVYVWYMDGANLIRDEHIATISDDLNWKIVGVGDFNGDGKPDILWHHQQRGEVYVWFMDGITYIRDQHIRTVGDDLSWKIVGVGDFNGDGKPDILWHHQQRGEVYVWFMDGATFVRDQHIRTINDDLLWKIVGVGDFNGDGKSDILWHHQQRGDVYVWFMDGATFLYDKYIRTVPEIEWQIEAVGDYNGDGKLDILWRNQRMGEVYVWYMDGDVFVRDQLIRIVEDTNWKIVN